MLVNKGHAIFSIFKAKNSMCIIKALILVVIDYKDYLPYLEFLLAIAFAFRLE